VCHAVELRSADGEKKIMIGIAVDGRNALEAGGDAGIARFTEKQIGDVRFADTGVGHTGILLPDVDAGTGDDGNGARQSAANR